ncbi:hypothetical protein [Cellulosilyticum sp. I15G10I2]|uniref:hypothetical protein n=1 Tax=Cellulosilyticum sp. I15G10I2 TaxID=1892843 RepID=UPI00114CF010|nr:hypothetical protein [Cellulosilyticum sp. I15G10I2]
MKEFTLQQKVTIYDNYGNPKDEWEDIDTIDVSIAKEKLFKVIGDQTYILHQPMGLTRYDKFEKKYQYKLVSSSEEYLIESFVIGKLTQLILKEVIVYE